MQMWQALDSLISDMTGRPAKAGCPAPELADLYTSGMGHCRGIVPVRDMRDIAAMPPESVVYAWRKVGDGYEVKVAHSEMPFTPEGGFLPRVRPDANAFGYFRRWVPAA